jgi:hypothetical protein
MDRRAFLRGAGISLGLPFLPSLISPKSARAADPPVPKNFVAFATHHGGIWGNNMFPTEAVAEKKSYAGREIRRSPLSAKIEGADAVLSPVLRAPSAVLTPALIAKMNVVRGVDIPFYIGHHTGGHLGNYARNDGNGNDGKVVQAMPRPTIDQVMAWSKSFYPDLSNVRERSLVIGRRISYGWSNPETRSGTVQEMASEESSLELFNRIFVPEDPAGARPPIVDRVLEDYKRLRDGSRRLSVADKVRLDDHMQRLSELQRKLNARATCGSVTKPGDSDAVRRTAGYDFSPELQAKSFDLLNDVIVAALICGTSRVAVVNAGSTFSDFTGDWHQDVAHKSHLPDGAKQKIIMTAHQKFFAGVFVDLMKKLDIDDGTGKTLLDRSLISWTQESCSYTHESQSIPIVMAGGAAGAIKTGNYVDYRNMSVMVNDGGFEGATEKTHAGICWNQYLGTVLQAMGLPRTEFERDGLGGYGIKYIGEGRAKYYPDAIFSVMGEMLPFLV